MSPRNKDVSHDSCIAVREVLNRVGDKWTVQVVAALSDGPRRFSELRRTVEGISQRMLTLTVRGLERDGLVLRSVEPSVPPKVSYELTRLGRTLLGPILALAEWAQDNRQEIDDARRKFDQRAPAASSRLVRVSNPSQPPRDRHGFARAFVTKSPR